MRLYVRVYRYFGTLHFLYLLGLTSQVLSGYLTLEDEDVNEDVEEDKDEVEDKDKDKDEVEDEDKVEV